MSSLKLKKLLEDKSKEELIEKYIELYMEKKKKDKRLQEEIEKLQKELKKYKNAHTPSSQKKFEKVKAKGLKVGRKKGKKSGHKGRTRHRDNPTKFVAVSTDFNPMTGNKNIEPTGETKEIVITDFEIIKVVTQYTLYEYKDLDTGDIFWSSHPDIPERGIFGKNVLAFASYLRFEGRVMFDKIASIFTNVFDISMTTPTAMDICTRVGEKVRPSYDALKEMIRKAKVVNADETGAKRNGLPGWLWGFFSLTIALFVFNKKRGGDILERILTIDFKGILGVDGWSTYKKFAEKLGLPLQRCWAHAIREVKEICVNKKRKNKSLEPAYAWFCDIFKQVKEARKIKSQKIREQKHIELTTEMNRWIEVYSSYKKLRKIVNKIKNGREYWFTCVLNLEVEPTNNKAEQMLRSWVVFRKIIGCLRSEKGEKTTETMLSLFGTWKLRNLHPYMELKSLLGA